jgi:hypothetical protein
MAEHSEHSTSVTWDSGGPYPFPGLYRLFLTDGRDISRYMASDFVWDDSFNGAWIDSAFRVEAP